MRDDFQRSCNTFFTSVISPGYATSAANFLVLSIRLHPVQREITWNFEDYVGT